MMAPEHDDTAIPVEVHLGRIARELATIRQLLATVANNITAAESEIPEQMRRFMNYFHDVHDIKFVYEEHGQQVPSWVNAELERCDDRFRHMLEDLHAAGGVFEKVKRDMAGRKDNRWDHTKALFPPKENADETRPSEQLVNGIDQSGTEVPRS